VISSSQAPTSAIGCTQAVDLLDSNPYIAVVVGLEYRFSWRTGGRLFVPIKHDPESGHFGGS